MRPSSLIKVDCLSRPVNNPGHTDFPGCFRCHDGLHSTSSRKLTITQDCNFRQELLAVEEAAPAVLRTLGLSNRIGSLQ